LTAYGGGGIIAIIGATLKLPGVYIERRQFATP
jgi:hypothetical protein